jgi:hypothetical protein
LGFRWPKYLFNWDNVFQSMDRTQRIGTMLKEQFEAAVAETRIRTPELVEAARRLLIDKESATDLAGRFDIETSKIYRAAKTVEEKWEEICEKRGWSFVAIALPKNLMKVMLQVQAEEISSYQAARDKKKNKKFD